MAMRWPCIEERFVAKIEHDTAKKTRSDVARKARIQARNDTPFTEAKAAREKKAEAAVKDEEAALHLAGAEAVAKRHSAAHPRVILTSAQEKTGIEDLRYEIASLV